MAFQQSTEEILRDFFRSCQCKEGEEKSEEEQKIYIVKAATKIIRNDIKKISISNDKEEFKLFQSLSS